MKKLLFILSLIPVISFGQITPVKVACGEYISAVLFDNGQVYATRLTGLTYEVFNTGRSNVTDMYGGQYAVIVRDAAGTVAVLNSNNSTTAIPTYTEIPVDTTGAVFNNNTFICALWQTYMTIRNNRIYYWGIDDAVNQNGGVPTLKPRALTAIPGGRIPIKIAPYAGQYFPGGGIVVLCTDGTVWEITPASTTPVQKSGITAAIDIGAMGVGVSIVRTTTDLLAWGYLASYVGLPDGTTTPTSLKTVFQDAGMVFGIRNSAYSYNSGHFVDTNFNHWTIGSAAAGELGTGQEYSPWRTQSPNPWNYNVTTYQAPFQNSLIQVPGKWANVFSSVSYTFYCYGLDMGGGLYFWGRQKAHVGPVPDFTTGLSSSYTSAIEALYSAAMIFPAPQKVNILNTTWALLPTFDLNSAKPPVASAGIDQYLATGETSTTLYGSGSSQQEGTISAYSWVVSSGSGTITNPTAMNPTITGLNGTTVVTLTVTGRNGVQRSSRTTIVASGAATNYYIRWKKRPYN